MLLLVSGIPLVWVLYLLISFLEDCGYMARIAFVMDRIFRRFGLSGRSFIPLLMGFGCGVPAVMATRTLDSEGSYNNNYNNCFYALWVLSSNFCNVCFYFFAGNNKTLVTYSLYMLSIVVAIIVSLILNKFVYKSAASNFVMELPRDRTPTIKSIAIHGWGKGKGLCY